MKTSASSCPLFASIALALLACSAPRLSAQAPSSPKSSFITSIEIVDGKISGHTEKGLPMPATLRNVVDVLTRRHPDVSITFVGVEDLVIDNVTLRLAPRDTSLDIALSALGEASGRKFRVHRSGPSDYLLLPDPQSGPSRVAEVFNLSALLASSQLMNIDGRLHEMETELTVVRKRLGEQHGRVVELKTEMEILAARRDAAGRPSKENLKVVDQIKETVSLTLQQLKSAEKQPEFQFHPGTNLLIVTGGRDAIDITRKVVAALEKGAK